MAVAHLSENQQQAIRLAWMPHGLTFELLHPAPWWTAATLPLLLAWVPIAAIVAEWGEPQTALLVAVPLALLDLAIVCAYWYRDARLTRWKVQVSANRVLVTDDHRVRLQARCADLDIRRSGRTLHLYAGRQHVELIGAGGVERHTVAWIERVLRDLRRQGERLPEDNPTDRARVLAMADRAGDG